MFINFELKKKRKERTPMMLSKFMNCIYFIQHVKRSDDENGYCILTLFVKKKINGTFFSSQTSILISSAFHMQFSFKFTTSQYTKKSWPIFCCKAWRLGASAEFKREWKKKQLSKEIDPSRRKYFFFFLFETEDVRWRLKRVWIIQTGWTVWCRQQPQCAANCGALRYTTSSCWYIRSSCVKEEYSS